MPSCAVLTQRHSPEVVVIGGGFAGLSAATALAEQGIHVVVIEARPTLGGRANTFRDPVTQERVDNGQHVLAGCYHETLRFLRRIGAVDRLHWPSTLRVPIVDEQGRTSELVLPPLPPPLDLVGGALAWDALTSGDRWAMLRIGRALRGQAVVNPHETVRQWLHRYGQSDRLCRLLWEPLALAALNQSIDHASAASFVAVTSRMFSTTPHASAILLPAVPLDELYVAPSLSYLRDRGCQIVPRTQAQVLTGAGSVVAVQAGDEQLHPAAVICTVPWFALGEVLADHPPALATVIANARVMKSLPIVTVDLWFDDDEPDQTFVGLPGRTFQWLFSRRRIVAAGQSHLSLVSSGAESICHTANDTLTTLAVSEARQAVPSLAEKTPRRALVIRERRATFSLRPGGPQRPSTETPVEGLFLAGDWIETGLPATIESAVISGHRAATACLQSLRTTRKSR